MTVSAGSGGGGVVSLVQQATAAGRAASLAVSLPTASTSGDALVATVGLAAGSSASVTGITDSGGGNWTKGPVGFQSGTNSRVELWYRVGASSVSGVTVTLSVAKPASVSVSEWAGVAAASALDGSAQGGTASSSTVGTPSLVTSNASDLVIGAVNYPVAATSTLTSSAFASLDDFSYSTSVHGRVAYAVTSAAGSYGVAWSLSAASGGSGGAILALKAAAGGGSSDTESPTVPQNLTAAAMGGSEIDLSWDASTDSGGSGLAGYNVYRDGTRVASVTPGTKTSYADTGLSPSTTHTYRVSAVDSATNESAQSAPASATTGGAGGGGVTLAPVADAYVNAGAATTNYGKATTLRVDASPATTSFLRFNVQGVSGSVSSVVLKVWANSSLSAGYSVNVVADDTWGESTVTSATAPAIGASVGSSGPVSSGGYTSITLTPSSVVGNGDVDFALVGLSSTALALASRESANPPLLIVNGS